MTRTDRYRPKILHWVRRDSEGQSPSVRYLEHLEHREKGCDRPERPDVQGGATGQGSKVQLDTSLPFLEDFVKAKALNLLLGMEGPLGALD